MSWGRNKSAPENLPAASDDDPGTAARILSHVLETSSRLQAPAIRAYVDRLRRNIPAPPRLRWSPSWRSTTWPR